MTFLRENNEKTFASRLKSLSDLLMWDVKRFYDSMNIQFEPRWFPVIYLLKEKGPMSVTELAKELFQSHSAINQTLHILEEKGMIESKKDNNDERKRMIQLSKKGKEGIKKLMPLWDVIFKANQELLNSNAPNFIAELNNLEKALSEKSLYKRIVESYNTQNSKVIIKGYKRNLKEHFYLLNKQWIEKYFKLETADLAILSNPEALIKNKGEIYFAEYNGKIAGTYALLPADEDTLEFLKFAVDQAFQKLGIGTALLNSAISRATKLKVKKVILYTNPSLIEANNLYIKNGFYYVENDKMYAFERPTVKMQLILS